MKTLFERMSEAQAQQSPASPTNCTTHHYACDCREAMFAEMVKALKATTGELKIFLAMLHDERTRSELQVVVDRAVAIIARATDQGEMK